MKSRIWSVLVVFVLILIISSTGLYAQRFSGRGVEWLTQVVERPYQIAELRQIFAGRNHKLSMCFHGDNFEEIGKYYGSLGWVKKPDNAGTATGIEQIASFFESLKNNTKFTRGVKLVTFRSEVIEIAVNEYLYYNPSLENPLEDPVYRITETIKIIYDEEDRSTVVLESEASYLHSRRTFDR